MQNTLSDDEPVPLVGEKRGRDDDDDPLFATGSGTQTGTPDGTGDEIHLYWKALKISTDARRDACRDKVMLVLGMFVVSSSIRLTP